MHDINDNSVLQLRLLRHIAMRSIECGLLLPQYRGQQVCLSVYVSVCLLVTTVSPAEKVEPIEVPLDLDLWS